MLSRPEGPFFFSAGLGWEDDGEGILGLGRSAVDRRLWGWVHADLPCCLDFA